MSYRIPNDLEQSTYGLRTGFRFGDGKPVGASAFANAFNRAVQPFVNAAGRIARRRGAAGQTAAPDRHLSGGRR